MLVPRSWGKRPRPDRTGSGRARRLHLSASERDKVEIGCCAAARNREHARLWGARQGRRMKSSSQERQHVLIIPGSLLATRPHADLGCSAVTYEVDGDLAQDGQVASCRSIPDAAVILTEGDIQDPMEPIFYGPMPADCLDQDLGVVAAAGQEIADLRFDLAGAVDTADGFHRQHGAQPGPGA